MESFSKFYNCDTLIKKLSGEIAESNDVKLLKSFVDALGNKDADKLFEAWYNPMDWLRGAGRFAATRFAAQPKLDHIEQLFYSLSDVIRKAGKWNDFENLLKAMNRQIQDLKTNNSARAAEVEPADPTQEPVASKQDAETSSKNPVDKTDTIAQQHQRQLSPEELDNILKTTSQNVGSSSMSPEELEKLVRQKELEKKQQQAGTPYRQHLRSPQGGPRQWGPQFGLGSRRSWG